MKQALILHRDSPGSREERLGRLLAFFGVPWESTGIAGLASRARATRGHPAYAVFGSLDTVAEAFAAPGAASALGNAAALYVYGGADPANDCRALSQLTARDWMRLPAATGDVAVTVTDRHPELTGPMSGMRFRARVGPERGLLAPDSVSAGRAGSSLLELTPIVTVDGVPAFFRVVRGGAPTFFCVSPSIIDIDAAVAGTCYDVKQHFLSTVPLVMFISSAFREAMWRPNELGACLIVDDPLLKGRYGFCDFLQLRDLMRQHHFTTSIAFIPWNWRRTTRASSEFFRRESDLFSVSVHGCDHVAAEFGATSPGVIDRRAQLAQRRMRQHEARTGIQHDPVMVFPQGVFSSACPEVLKRNGFVAAVNTEVAPVDGDGARTTIRDVWDTAILKYGSFPIYTRRYQHHGLENFAFDLLLGKPCFIVAHHESFRDDGAGLVAFIDALAGLNCTLQWRSPREVIRRAFRTRTGSRFVEVEMYGTEILLTNGQGGDAEFRVRRRESDASAISDVLVAGRSIKWSRTPAGLEFSCTLPPGSALVEIRYENGSPDRARRASMTYELSVAARRIACELRDEYVSRWYRPSDGDTAAASVAVP